MPKPYSSDLRQDGTSGVPVLADGMRGAVLETLRASAPEASTSPH
jgi:hypothetical protein